MFSHLHFADSISHFIRCPFSHFRTSHFIRALELSLPGTYAPGSESSIGGTFAPGSESSMERSLPEANIEWNFHSRERKFHGTKVPWNFRSQNGKNYNLHALNPSLRFRLPQNRLNNTRPHPGSETSASVSSQQTSTSHAAWPHTAWRGVDSSVRCCRRAPERPDVIIIKHLRLVSRVARPWRCTALGRPLFQLGGLRPTLYIGLR